MTFTLSRRGFIASTAALSAAPRALNAKSVVARAQSGPFDPLVRQRADAQIFRHDDGHYYMTGSVPEYDRLTLRRSKTLAGLATADEVVLWRHDRSGPLAGLVWAPQLHLIDGRWTLYFAAGPGGGEDIFRIRTYAMLCDGADPMSSKWGAPGRFQAPWDSFNHDATSFVHRGKRYIVWAQQEPGIDTDSNLYIAPLASPLTLAGKATRLTIPALDWEVRGYKAAEAPAILHRNGRLFLTYSAGATDARSCIGLLTAPDDADIMDARVWVKSPQPVFATCRETGVYGPGHGSFTVDEKGRDILVCHGRDYETVEGDPLFNPDRHTRIQRLYYKADGTPDFGVPVGNGPLPERFASAADAKRMLALDGRQLIVGDPALPQTQFRSLPGRAGRDSVMLSPILLRDHYLVANDDGSVTLEKDSKNPDFALHSQFVRFEDRKLGTRFVSIAVPGRALGVADGRVALVPSRRANAYWRAD